MLQISRSARANAALLAMTLLLLLLVAGCSKQAGDQTCGTVQTKIVRGSSLAPIILPGQNITVLAGHYECNEVKRGDIIMFTHPNRDAPIIKAVRGVPGDQVRLGDNADGTYSILVNDQVLETSQGQRYEFYEQDVRILLQEVQQTPRIPNDKYLILGEDVHGAFDSTFFGLMNRSSILGKVNISVAFPTKDAKRDAQAVAAPAAPPNVLIITIDTLRADHMGTYGYGRNTTPFLDSLFAKGVVYENAITPAYLTFQSDASMLSSAYPSQHNIMDWNNRVSTQYPLLPHILGYYNYTRAAFVSPSLWETFEMNNSFDAYYMASGVKNINDTKKHVSEYLRRQQGPVLLFWHTYDVHMPYYAPPKEFYDGDYDGVFRNEILRQEVEYHIAWVNQTMEGVEIRYIDTPNASRGERNGRHRITPEDAEYLTAAYDYGISYTDAQLEMFFRSIQDEPWYNNTIIIITAEHGEDLEEHGYVFHRDLYDVNTRVPLAIIYPAKLAPRRVKDPVSTFDIAPTVLILLNITVPANAEGQDILGATDPARKVFTERAPFDEYSVRTAKHKYILRNPQKKTTTLKASWFMIDLMRGESDTLRDELYDLQADPLEQHNLLGQGLPVEAELRADAVAFRERMRRARQANSNITLNRLPIFTYP